MSIFARRPEEGQMHQAIDACRGKTVFEEPQLGQTMLVIDSDTETMGGGPVIWNLGRVVACGFEDGSGRSFWATTHRMSRMKEPRYQRIHVVLHDAIPSLKAWNA